MILEKLKKKKTLLHRLVSRIDGKDIYLVNKYNKQNLYSIVVVGEKDAYSLASSSNWSIPLIISISNDELLADGMSSECIERLAYRMQLASLYDRSEHFQDMVIERLLENRYVGDSVIRRNSSIAFLPSQVKSLEEIEIWLDLESNESGKV